MIIADQLNISVLHKLVTYSKPSYNIRIIYWVNYNMPAVAKILSRGRMTIPKEIRKYLGLKAGEKLVFIKSQNELVIRRKYDSKT